MDGAVQLSDSRLANLAAGTIAESWASLSDRYRIVTRRARHRFLSRDWAGIAADHVERLDLYSLWCNETEKSVRSLLADRVEDRSVWTGMKAVYSGSIQARPDWELAETFFNSITRRIFSTVGVDDRIEFVDTDYDSPPTAPPEPVTVGIPGGTGTAEIVRAMITRVGLDSWFASLGEDCELAAEAIDRRLVGAGGLRTIDRIEAAAPVFYRGRGAYLIGRISSGSQTLPLVLAILHRPEGLVVDAVLTSENEVSILFSFTRSHFHVDTAAPSALVHFLGTLMPRKRRAELYNSIGHDKHGKTELYRELRRHLRYSADRFEKAKGVEGLVMVVFTLPGFDVVLKVIRDTFGPPKRITRRHVLSRYRLVFRHDRAGRLIDAQEYEHLELPRARFDPSLLAALVDECGRTVAVDGPSVHIAHAYVERRVTPLDVFLADADPDAALNAVIDYGMAIKELAASGIFPGDMLLKNFGVTRHGRVVFYDYDELTTIDECIFRTLPVAPDYDLEMSAEPWFSVGHHDVFPEELQAFLGLQGELRDAFLDRHADVFDPGVWEEWKTAFSSRTPPDIIPYTAAARLRPDPISAGPAAGTPEPASAAANGAPAGRTPPAASG